MKPALQYFPMSTLPVVWKAWRTYVCPSGQLSDGLICLRPVLVKSTRNARGVEAVSFQANVRLKSSNGFSESNSSRTI